MNRILPLILVFALVLSTTGTAALWEQLEGSDHRPYHCVPVDDPQWREPTLEFLDPWEEDYNNNVPRGLWVIDQEKAPWLDVDGNVLVAVTTGDSVLRIYDSDYILHHDEETTIGWFPELMDVYQTGEPMLVVPSGLGQTSALYNLKGEHIQNFTPDLIVPGLLGISSATLGLPALGDFTDDGNHELAFGGINQWHAYRPDGDMIAQKPVIDPYDRVHATTSGHSENDRDYIYKGTTHFPDYMIEGDPLPVMSRLYKLTLEPVPGEIINHQYNTVWMNQFEGIIGFRALRFFDLTGDGQDEVILSHTPRGNPEVPAFTIMDLHGKILYQSPWNTSSTIAIGDVNGDGINEVVAMLYRESLTNDPDRITKPWTHIVGVHWHDGQGFEEIYSFQADDEYGGGPMVLCDLDGDGRDEILMALGEPNALEHGHGKMKIFKTDGELLWEYPFPYGRPHNPRIVDFTGDGQYELILSTTATQLFVFSLGGTNPPDESDADPYHAFLDTHNLTSHEPDQQPGLRAATSDSPSVLAGIVLVLVVAATIRSHHRPRSPF